MHKEYFLLFFAQNFRYISWWLHFSDCWSCGCSKCPASNTCCPGHQRKQTRWREVSALLTLSSINLFGWLWMNNKMIASATWKESLFFHCFIIIILHVHWEVKGCSENIKLCYEAINKFSVTDWTFQNPYYICSNRLIITKFMHSVLISDSCFSYVLLVTLSVVFIFLENE